MDVGLLMVRLVVGGLLVVHGSQKLFGWFGGGGLGPTGTFMAGLGFRPGRFFAALTGVAEFGGGLAFGLGVLQPLAAALVVAVMIVAIATVHWGHGLLASTGGLELPLLYLAVAASLGFTGPGEYSLDAVIGLMPWWTSEVSVAAVAAGALGGFMSLALRRSGVAIAHA